MLHGLNFVLIFISLIYVVSSASLYKPDDPLWELDSSNFQRIVLGKDHAWIIQFYNSWCGHCMRFAPIFQEFARDIKTWRNVIDVAVVNCAVPENVKLCRSYNVGSFPTIKFFWTQLNESDKGDQLVGKRDIDSLEKAIIRFLELHWSKGVPLGWPNIQPIEASSIEELVGLIPESEDSLYLLVENRTSLVGRKIILDLSFQKSVILRRMLSTNNKILTTMLNDETNSSLPLLLNVKKNGKTELIYRFSSEMNSTDIRNQVFLNLIGHPRTKDDKEITDNVTDDKVKTSNAVYMVDIENAVHYSLRQEVGMHENISGKKLLALKAYILALKSYFPGTPSVMGYLTKLNNWVSHRKNNVTGEEFLQAMDELQDEKEFLPAMHDWVGCAGSQEKYRGYPCSLWTLFHTLTVQAYNFYEDYQESLNQDPIKILVTIRNYVKYFFSCEECSRHFQEMAINMKNEIKLPRDGVLWLWNAHNKVNRRLAGDATEDPQHPKIQFPSRTKCPRCRILNNDQNDIVWDKSLVLRYLQHFYHKDNIKLDVKIIDQAPLPPENIKLENTPVGKGRNLTPAMKLLQAMIYSTFYYNFRSL